MKIGGLFSGAVVRFAADLSVLRFRWTSEEGLNGDPLESLLDDDVDWTSICCTGFLFDLIVCDLYI